ncbi:putative integral membrane protein [Mycobacterium tuberculosis]|nr:putative integral membrane protein [Mycobacterium tuberculosis]
MFSGAIDRRLDEQAMHSADATPAAVQASASLQQARNARTALDSAVERARGRLDDALVVARCEYHPTPACPQTRITGVPGRGPETRTANQLLADAQRELDNALAARDHQAPALDAKMAHDEQALAEVRQAVVADAGRGLGSRWVAMNDLTLASAGALTARMLAIAFFALLYLLPLILRLWRGDTTHDRHAAARAERERAELEADTAIAIKRAEVRRAAETEAASRTVAQLPAGAAHHRPGIAKNLPAQVQPEGAVEPREKRATPVIRSIPDATKAAARWIRPLVPPFVARMLDNTTAPLRTARQVFEEVEEIAFSFKRTHKVTVNAEGSDPNDQPPLESHSPAAPAESNPIASSDSARRSRLATNDDHPPLAQVPPRDLASLSVGSTGELTQREGPHELRSPDGPRQLPPPR